MESRTVSNTTPRAIVDLFAKYGNDMTRWFSKPEIVTRIVENPKGRTSFEDVVRLWRESYLNTRDRMIGVKVARQLSFGTFNVIDYMMATSENPKNGLDSVLCYYPLINKGFDLTADTHRKRGFVELQNPVDKKLLPFQYVDFVFACVMTRIRFSNYTDWTPDEVWFTCPAPEEKQDYESFFGAPVRFSQSVNRILFRTESLETPQPNADPYLYEMLENHAKFLMRQLPAEPDLLTELSCFLRERLPFGNVDLNDSARQMGMSRRSLQRRLRTQGLSYRTLLRNIRRDIAIELLGQRDRSVEEVGFMIGYADTSSFHRAFKKWTGKNPSEYLSN